MKDISYQEHNIVHYLKQTLTNYDLKQTQLAKTLDITPTMLGEYLKGARKPNKKTLQKMWDKLCHFWQPGIIELPPQRGRWNGNYYIAVMDIKNPFETWKDIVYHGMEPETFYEWMTDWEKRGEFQVVQLFTDYEDFKYNYYKESHDYNWLYEEKKRDRVHAIMKERNSNDFYGIWEEITYEG